MGSGMDGLCRTDAGGYMARAPGRFGSLPLEISAFEYGLPWVLPKSGRQIPHSLRPRSRGTGWPEPKSGGMSVFLLQILDRAQKFTVVE